MEEQIKTESRRNPNEQREKYLKKQAIIVSRTKKTRGHHMLKGTRVPQEMSDPRPGTKLGIFYHTQATPV